MRVMSGMLLDGQQNKFIDHESETDSSETNSFEANNTWLTLKYQS